MNSHDSIDGGERKKYSRSLLDDAIAIAHRGRLHRKLLHSCTRNNDMPRMFT